MKHFLKTFFTILLIAFIIIQFFRPEENKSAVIAENDLTKKFTVPADVNNILKASCTDFHSSNTDYPFYFKVQPLAWILADHIKTGKTQLDFSEFGSYCVAKQYMQFENIVEDIKTDDMPLNYYVLIHRHTILSEEKKAILLNWSEGIMNQLKAKNPCDVFDKK